MFLILDVFSRYAPVAFVFKILEILSFPFSKPASLAERHIRRAMPWLPQKLQRSVARQARKNPALILAETLLAPRFLQRPHSQRFCLRIPAGAVRILAKPQTPAAVPLLHAAAPVLCAVAVSHLVPLPLSVLASSNPRAHKLFLKRVHSTYFRQALVLPRGPKPAKLLRAALQEKRPLFIAPDQRQQVGRTSRFLSLPFIAPAAPAAVARSANAPIIPAYTARLSNPSRRRVHFLQPFQSPLSQYRTDDISLATLNVNRALETFVRRSPEQWIWQHDLHRGALKNTPS